MSEEQQADIAQLRAAVDQLCRSERGRRAVQRALSALSGGAVSLDIANQDALVTVYRAAWKGYLHEADSLVRQQR